MANIRMFLEKAGEYEKTSFKGVFHFIQYMDQLRSYDIDYGEATVLGEEADVVRIMSIHKSKGLEFPVVFYPEPGKCSISWTGISECSFTRITTSGSTAST